MTTTRGPRTTTTTTTDVAEAQPTESPHPQDGAWQAAREASALDARMFSGAFGPRVWGGRYEMDGLLGRGGQGTTFVGTDRKTGARIAVKIFDLGRAKDWKSQQLFEREVQTLQTIEHPGMPAFLEVLDDETTGARGLVMSLVPGEPFDVVVKRDGPLSEALLWRVLLDVTDVLSALHGHSSPIVHRDVKPANLIRRPDGRTAIVDFGGVGKARGQSGSTVVGTFGYMAPEQLYGTQSPSTDLYSLGATLLTLATGREPEDQPRKGLAIDVDEAAPGLSAELRTLLKRLLAPEPQQRPHDAAMLSRELQAIARGARSTSGEAKPEPPTVVGAQPMGLDAPRFAVSAVVMLIVGMLGIAGSVVLGQLMLPLLLTIAASFAPPEQRRRMHDLRDGIRQGARSAQVHFNELRMRGADQLAAMEQYQHERHKGGSRRDRQTLRREEARRVMEAEVLRHSSGMLHDDAPDVRGMTAREVREHARQVSRDYRAQAKAHAREYRERAKETARRLKDEARRRRRD